MARRTWLRLLAIAAAFVLVTGMSTLSPRFGLVAAHADDGDSSHSANDCSDSNDDKSQVSDDSEDSDHSDDESQASSDDSEDSDHHDDEAEASDDSEDSDHHDDESEVSEEDSDHSDDESEASNDSGSDNDNCSSAEVKGTTTTKGSEAAAVLGARLERPAVGGLAATGAPMIPLLASGGTAVALGTMLRRGGRKRRR